MINEKEKEFEWKKWKRRMRRMITNYKNNKRWKEEVEKKKIEEIIRYFIVFQSCVKKQMKMGFGALI
jgi:hypothetical protein